jgi:hypothetical protein
MHEVAIPLQVGYNLANLKNGKRQLIIGWAQSRAVQFWHDDAMMAFV